jgi:hypothetical protein
MIEFDYAAIITVSVKQQKAMGSSFAKRVLRKLAGT